MREAVVFVHGLYMVGAEMSWLRRQIRQRGYSCHQFRYHSMLRPPRENAAALQRYLQRIDAEVIHLVAHSLGGIVVAHLFDLYPEQRPGRVVMLGAPLNGSALARVLHRSMVLRPLLGRATERGLLGNVPRWKGVHPLGIVAGSQGIGMGRLFTFDRLEQPNDGTVTMSDTATSGISDAFTAPVSHLGMLFNRVIAAQVCHFLREGSFDRRG